MADVYASVDLGGTNIGAAILDREGKILQQAEAATASHEGPDGVLQRTAELVNRLARDVGTKPKALGMGVPGLADLVNGTTLFLPNFPTHWRNVPVRERLRPALGCDVYLINDARAAALGELAFGSGSSARTMVFFTLGTGVGGGVVIDRKLHLGPLGAAGELGHLPVLEGGAPCGCGSTGCLETLASASALSGEGVRLLRSGNAPALHEIVGGDANRVNPKTMGEAANRGDALVAHAIKRVGHYLGIASAQVVTALHADLIVFGGGMAGLGDLILDPVRRTLRERVRMVPTDDIRVECSTLGDDAGILGAAALAINGGRVTL